MNMWGVTPEFLDVLDKGFAEFLANVEPGNIKAEYLLPTIIGDMLAKGEVSVKVLETQDKWIWCNLSGRSSDCCRCFCKTDRGRCI